MLNLFSDIEEQDYLGVLHKRMIEEINKTINTEGPPCNPEEWIKYFSDKYYVAPITVLDADIQEERMRIDIKKKLPFPGHIRGKDHFTTGGIKVTFKIPFTGEPDLFRVRPKTFSLLKFPTQSFKGPSKEGPGIFTLEFRYTNQEIQDKGDNLIRERFEDDFRNYQKRIDQVNDAVKAYNVRLQMLLDKYLEKSHNQN